MHIGAIFPTLEIGSDPAAIRDYAQAAKEMGYQHLVLLDHVLGFDRTDLISAFGPLSHSTPLHEPLVLMGFLAACTQRVIEQAGEWQSGDVGSAEIALIQEAGRNNVEE